jgi:hypothetical protein
MKTTRTKSTWPTALALVGLEMVAQPAWASELGARLVSARGTVEVSGAAPVKWTAASQDRVVRAGESIRTGSRSSAVLELDGARITLYETTLLKIPQSATTVATNASNPFRHPVLDQGRALFNIAPRKTSSGFSVRTPMLVAGVKGTIFEVVTTRTEHAVYVWEGAVEVRSTLDPSNVEMVLAGEHTVMDDRRLTPHTPIPADRERPADANREALAPSAPSLPVESERALVSESTPDRDLLTSPEPELTAKADDPFDAWLDADRAVIDLVSTTITEIQTVISYGEVRPAISSSSRSDTNLTDPLSNIVSSVTDPLTSTVSSVTDPLTSTVSSVTAPLTSTVSSVTAPLTSTVSSVTAPLTSTVSSVTSPVTSLLGF